MCKTKIKPFLVGLFMALALAMPSLAQSAQGRLSRTPKGNATIDLDRLTQAEQRAESLRERLLEIQLKETDLQARLDELDYRLTPEGIRRALAFVGSVRPMDELRDSLRTRLENEKARVNKQLELLASNRERLESAIDDADAEVQRLRQRVSADDE